MDMKKLLSALFVCLLFISIIFFSEVEDNSYVVKLDKITVKSEKKIFLIWDETILISEFQGKIKYMAAQGEKLRANQEIALVDKSNQKSVILSSLNILYKDDRILNDIKYLKNGLVYLIQNNKLSEISLVLEKLELITSRYKNMGKNIELNNIKLISDNIITAPVSGILSYYFDGYEGAFNTSTAFNIDYSQFKKNLDTNVSGEFLNQYGQIGKIIDTSILLFAIPIDRQELVMSKDKTSFIINVNNVNIIGKKIGFVEDNNGAILILSSQDVFKDFHKSRFIDGVLVFGEYKGYIVPNTSLVKNRDEYGVYYINDLGRAEYRKVEILAYNEDNVILSETGIDLYDTIVKNVENISQGDVIEK
jgi:hypothetical protein